MFRTGSGWRRIAKQEKLAVSKIRSETERPALINRVEHTSCRPLIEPLSQTVFQAHPSVFQAYLPVSRYIQLFSRHIRLFVEAYPPVSRHISICFLSTSTYFQVYPPVTLSYPSVSRRISICFLGISTCFQAYLSVYRGIATCSQVYPSIFQAYPSISRHISSCFLGISTCFQTYLSVSSDQTQTVFRHIKRLGILWCLQSRLFGGIYNQVSAITRWQKASSRVLQVTEMMIHILDGFAVPSLFCPSQLSWWKTADQ